MEQSLFIQWVNKFFPGITVRVVETLNDTKNPLTYLHRRMLRKDFSVNGKWESVTTANTMVMADVVAMDSSLPLKKRDAISKANGDITKMGMELKLNEKQLTELDALVAQNATDAQILAKLFADTPKVIGGIYERLEAMFLEGLSTGLTLVEDTENVGTGIRLDYGFLTANKFGVATLWSNTAAKPFDDIEAVLEKARVDGNVITRALIERVAFNNLAKTTQAKELFAFNSGFVGSNIPVPSLAQVNSFTSDRYGFVFEIVDRSVKYEKNGTQTAVKPFATGAVTFVCDDVVGSLTWARLAEMNHPVENVSYSTVDDYILVSKFRQNKPSLSEYTSSQARVVPVINNVDRIYLLDSTTVTA
jgi:hypothetical protein